MLESNRTRMILTPPGPNLTQSRLFELSSTPVSLFEPAPDTVVYLLVYFKQQDEAFLPILKQTAT